MQKKSILSIKINSDNPCCDHGPSILFESTKDKYYGCAAFRDPKACGFRLKANDIIKKPKIKTQREHHPSFKLKEFLSIDKNSRFYCHDCNKLFTNYKLDSNARNSCLKSKHRISSNVSESDINFPTRFLTASTNNKTNAQYLFSEEFLKYLIITFRSLKIDKVICIGAPRVHETLLEENRSQDSGICSFLLDIDDRLMQFHENSFGLYNMFNNYFLIEDHSKKFENFLTDKGQCKNILLFCDPPFGGLLEPLSITLDALKSRAESEGYVVHKMIILPYFLGKKLNQYNDCLNMLDYRVMYENHKRMDKSDDNQHNQCLGNRRESVVRIFTDYKQDEIKPPNGDNYRFCSICQRFSHVDNKHCNKCSKCTTRHGPTYVHCDQCDKCRQPTKKHCNKCGFCNALQHKCCDKRINN